MSSDALNATALVGSALFSKGVTDTVWKVHGKEIIYMYVANGLLMVTAVAVVVLVVMTRRRVSKTNHRINAFERAIADHRKNCPVAVANAGCSCEGGKVRFTLPTDRMTQNVELEHQTNGDCDITIERTRTIEIERDI